jgi:hypothetical protein
LADAVELIDNQGELASWLSNPANEGRVVKTYLKTSDRVIARVTDGIYRQPSSALRELISNAWDADAKNVAILTDAPRFSRIYIRDDGVGMSDEVLARLLHNIGGSAKRHPQGIRLLSCWLIGARGQRVTRRRNDRPAVELALSAACPLRGNCCSQGGPPCIDQGITFPAPPSRLTYPDRQRRGAGCGGRGCAFDERRVMRTAKSCGPDTPTLVSSCAGFIRAATVATKPGHRGEREISRKTIAQGRPDCLR